MRHGQGRRRLVQLAHQVVLQDERHQREHAPADVLVSGRARVQGGGERAKQE